MQLQDSRFMLGGFRIGGVQVSAQNPLSKHPECCRNPALLIISNIPIIPTV